ncbi:MAG: class I SAM-dependent methyltransferase [Proteobacteria bacterium]|nr:class I SAM-dependent methyltransferase [Pseudomonadota bacterium]
MNSTPPPLSYSDFLSFIHRSVSPYQGISGDGGSATPQGWSSDNPLFAELIDAYRPSVVIEVDTWKGASAIHMANTAKQNNLECTILCIDTWLGSAIHWKEDAYRKDLNLKNGFPMLYFEFLENVVAADHTDIIVPLPLPSEAAFRWLQEAGTQADLVYIDADHEAASVYLDISNYWQLVKPGGALFGDDYLGDWPGVVRAVQLFGEKISVEPEIFGEKWLLRK